MATMTITHTRDVDKKPPRETEHRRPTGELISPLTYTNDLVDFDHWDHMFITNCCNRLTLHDFDGPPSTILDLGCGRGLWAVEAGRHWQGSTIVGFDVEPVQPKLSLLDKSLSRRLKWVYGNLLDGLPFLDGQFDFVRMVRMGLHIPEDEWGYVLAEISRVLSPDGVLEIIEEDLIFPSRISSSSSVTPTSGSPGNDSPRSSDTTISNRAPFAGSDPSITGTTLLSESSSSSLPLGMRSADAKHSSTPDPRDHSRLRLAWEKMLNDRFLAPDLISVLPFHLGAWFRDIRSHTPFEVSLPPSSSQKQSAQLAASRIDPDTLFELRPLSSTASQEFDEDTICPPDRRSRRAVSLRASMHLARTVRTVTACKESIWCAYQSLYGKDPSIPSLVRSAQEKYLKNHFDQVQSTTNPLRDYFEHDWMYWESDMADRTSVRGSIQSELSWNEPFGKPPEWSTWFNSLPPLDEANHEERPEPCRRLRGFVCFKHDMATMMGRIRRFD